jgi:eight-cysteine-cluster-containing protein
VNKNKIIIYALLISLFLSGCATKANKIQAEIRKQVQVAPKEDFCGSSTYGICSSHSDCSRGGCSGQFCQSRYEEGIISTCEYRDCYNAAVYNLGCKCIRGKCQWAK